MFLLQLKLYNTVIDDVIAGVRDAFLDEGVDEQVLQEMRQVWTSKLMASKAVEVTIDSVEPQAPPAVTNNTPKSKVNHHRDYLYYFGFKMSQLNLCAPYAIRYIVQ